MTKEQILLGVPFKLDQQDEIHRFCYAYNGDNIILKNNTFYCLVSDITDTHINCYMYFFNNRIDVTISISQLTNYVY